MEFNEIIKTAVDAYHGNVQKYSVGESQAALRNALVEMNGGSSVLDYRKVRRGECAQMFDLIEQILDKTVVEGLQDSDFFNQFVDFRNVAAGDQNVFTVRDSNLFTVAEIADGTQDIRRQRLGGETQVAIPTSVKAVRIYEELSRILSGRVDFNEMIGLVAESFQKKILDDIYTVWANLSDDAMGGSLYNVGYNNAGAYSESTLLDLIAHVEAAAGGKTATIVGTKSALRNLQESIQADSAREELHGMGYYGKFFGSPCLALPQRHQVGTTNFVFDDNVLNIVAGDDKFIKFVYEGDPLIISRDASENMDLTQELEYALAA